LGVRARTGWRCDVGVIGIKNPRRRKAQNRAHTLATRKNAIAQRAVNRGGTRIGGRQKAVERSVDGQTIFFEK
jgi:hypothetical protein